MTPDDAGNPPFPHDHIVNPYPVPADLSTHLRWRTDDWDPALQFWSLPFDPYLTEWLTATDLSLASTLAAREFAGQHSRWIKDEAQLEAAGWMEAEDLAWRPGPGRLGWTRIRPEIEELQQLMVDDRARYLAEAEQQADGVADYFIHFLGASRARHPWTIELIACGLAIGNIAYLYYKAQFRRVRPSFLCPGLVPPFGPPAHPAFPSGHSFLGHLIALLLLEIPDLSRRYGVFDVNDGRPGAKPDANTLVGTGAVASPLIWLAQRLAKNRERIGVHYPSDSSASRHLAAGIWRALLYTPSPPFPAPVVKDNLIDCPTLKLVLARAQAEWPVV